MQLITQKQKFILDRAFYDSATDKFWIVDYKLNFDQAAWPKYIRQLNIYSELIRLLLPEYKDKSYMGIYCLTQAKYISI